MWKRLNKNLHKFKNYLGFVNSSDLNKYKSFSKNYSNNSTSHDYFYKGDTNEAVRRLEKLNELEVINLVQKFQRLGHMCIKNKKEVVSQLLEELEEIDFQNPTQKLPTYLSYKNKTDLFEKLTNIYCTDIYLEFDYLNTIEKDWLNNMFVLRDEKYEISIDEKIDFVKLMNRAEYFDKFLSVKFQSVKRYSGEGAESLIVCINEILKASSVTDINTAVISMAHRGRNNLLTVLLKYPPILYFRKMLGLSEFPNSVNFATGDTFSHFHMSTDMTFNEHKIHVSLIPNPSHLECNIPVGAGKLRSKMLSHYPNGYVDDYEEISSPQPIGIFVHGDASVCGQGIVSESLVMTNSPNFKIGGSIHIVVNNGVGFTTNTPMGLVHVTDVGRVIYSPVIHVNAFDVSKVAQASKLALDYRNTFKKDVFINLICFRKWGHNELDDPTITQPLMYAKIANLQSIPQTFMDSIKSEMSFNLTDIEKDLENWKTQLSNDLVNAPAFDPQLMTFKKQWKNQKLLDIQNKSIHVYDTGFDRNLLKELGLCSVYVPDKFTVHHNVLKTHIHKRIEKLNSSQEKNIDWATAEALAIGSLLSEGFNCRISGQDVGRGTFNHRHFCLTDQNTNKICLPFNECVWPNSVNKRGILEIANSILSEEAVLGFEVGMALDNPDNLIIWEAQFGDFFNGAQIIFDTYLGSSETKWLMQNGLTILLPHGYDGAGPEHSSCKIERFLQLTDSSETQPDSDLVNMAVVNPTTPAQYFHLLRRQLHRPFRRPLIVIAPKLLLRSPLAVSDIRELDKGTYFHNVLPYTIENTTSVKTVILCSGKHFYTLKEYLETKFSDDIQNKFTIIRLEQLTPFPVIELKEELSKYINATSFVWCQEEHRNMGAWQFVETRCRNLLGIYLFYAGRKELSTPAVGISKRHKDENEMILKYAFSDF